MPTPKPRYSGPHRTGVCVCGHSWEEHHPRCVMNKEYYEATGEAYVPGECEYYGCNETGGMKPDPCNPDGRWVGHCHRYLDTGEAYPRLYKLGVAVYPQPVPHVVALEVDVALIRALGEDAAALFGKKFGVQTCPVIEGKGECLYPWDAEQVLDRMVTGRKQHWAEWD